MTGPTSADSVIERVSDAVARVPGVAAVVLGGSRARGWHNPHSDIDIGLYYTGSTGLDVVALNDVARALDDDHRRDLATAPGGWGFWVDGGAWLRVADIPVDLIYRDLERVNGVIAQVGRGEFQIAYHAGHPHSFVSSFYAAEVAVGLPLRDLDGYIAACKTQLSPYPDALRSETVRRFLGEAQFSLALMQKAIHAADMAYGAGVAFRIVGCLAHALFALNREWLMNEKGAVARAAGFPLHPDDFLGRVDAVFADLAANPAMSAEMLGGLVAQTVSLRASC